MKSRILIVEDEPFSAARLNQQLRELGYDPIATSPSGEEAEALAEELRFDLAIVDLRLEGEMDGITLASKLRERFSIPSILVTGTTDQKLIERALESFPYGFLTKPLNSPLLRMTVEMALQRLRAETTLREREEQLDTVLQTSMDSFWILGLDGRILDVNDASCHLTGYSREELLQMNLVQIEHGRTREQIAAGIELLLQIGAMKIERFARCKDGRLRLIEMSVTCSPPPQRRLYCFGRDVTERHAHEVALKESERILRTTLDSLPDAAALKDNDGRYLAVNAVWCKIYSRTPAQVLGKTDFDFFPVQLAAQYAKRDESVRTSCMPLTKEIEHKDKNGGTAWLEVRKYPSLDAQNQCVGLICITRDITERRNADNRLQLLIRAVDQSPVSIIITNSRGEIEYVNPYFERNTGYSRQEVIGQTPRFLKAGDQPKSFYEDLWAMISSGHEWRGEMLNKKKDGSYFWEQASISSVRNEQGEIVQFVAVKEDITVRKQSEEALKERLALRERLAKIVANVPGIIYAYRLRPDGSTCIPYASPAFEELCGVRAEDLVEDASSFFNLIPREDRTRMKESREESARALSPWRCEFRVQRPGGRLFWAEAQSTPESETDGSILWHGFMSDITDRKHTEDVLRTSEERLRLALQAGRLGAFEHSVSDNRVLTSPEFCQIVGCSLQTSLSQGELNELLHPDDLSRFLADLRRMLDEQAALDIEYRIGRPNGNVRWIRAMASPVIEDGKVERVNGVVQDITERKLAESELRKLSRAVEQSPASIVITDPSGNIEYVNPHFERTTGYTIEEAIGKNPRILKAGDKPKSFYEDLWKTIASGREWRGEMRNKKKDGSFFWEQASISSVRNEQGEIVQYIAVKEDITERKLAQTALSQRQSYLLAIIENQRGMVWLKDLEGRFLTVNRSFAEAFSLPAEAFVGKTDFDITSHELAESYHNIDRQVIKSRSPAIVEEKIIVHGVERLHETIKSPVFGHNGRVIGTTGYSYDITERRKAERQTIQQESYLRAIIENQPGLVWLKDTECRFLAVNQAYATACNRAHPKDVLERTDFEIWPQDLAKKYQVDDLRVMQSGKPFSAEELVQIGNDRRWFETFKTPVLNTTGETIGIAGFCHDVTTRRHELEELVSAKNSAESANRAKSAFLATMSHELRTPLNVINGMAALLAQENWPSEHKHAIDLISEGGNNLLQIIEEILDYSGLQAGETRLDLAPFSVTAIVGASLRFCAAAAQAKELNLTCWLDPKTPAEVLGDPRRLQQILVNLLHNAIKFTEHGRVHLSMNVRALANDGYTLEFSVLDSGIGIAVKSIGKLFRPFSQADSSITRRFGGTGLGLAITKSFVDLMGGDITVRSRLNCGTVFRFQIKLKATNNRASAFHSLSDPVFKLRRALVVGESRAQCRMIEALARDWGMVPVVVRSNQISPTAPYPEVDYDVAILPILKLANNSHPLLSWLAQSGRGARLPIVWLGDRTVVPPACCTAPSVRVNAFVDPAELSQALKEIFPTSSTGLVKPAAKQEKPKPLADSIPLSILAAEDNATNREVIKLVLRHLGYRVDLVENGAEAVAAVLRKKYDLLLLDIQMPVMDGLTAAREICRLIPDPAQRLKIVALTANALPGDRESCLAAGMDAYLTKPIVPVDLIANIRRFFQTGGDAQPETPPRNNAHQATAADSLWLDTAHLETITTDMTPDVALDTLRQLHDCVRSDYEGALPAVIECCAQQDQKHFAETIHGLKGCFMMTGWPRAGTLCAEAITAARKGEFKEWLTFVDNLKTAYAHSSQIMSAYLEMRTHTNHRTDTLSDQPLPAKQTQISS